MQKLSICLATLAILVAPAVKATNLGGIISTNTTLTKANSPYNITSNLLVDVGATLTIEAGVEVKIDPGILFYVDGSLRANGTESEPISFNTSVANPAAINYWKGIVVRPGTTDSVIMNYCDIKHSHRAFDVDERPFVLTHSKISKCYAALFFSKGYLVLKDNLFTDNNDGLVIDDNCHVEITGNEFSKHYATAFYTVNNVGGIISNNNLHDNGRAMSIGACNYFYPVEITNNTIIKNNTGILVFGLEINSVVRNNIIAYNKLAFSTTGTDGLFTANTFKFNQDAIAIGWWGSGFQFHSNCIDSTINRIVINNSAQDLNIANNYWGTIDTVQMHNMTYDYYDNFASGKVYYTPYLGQADLSCQVVGTGIVTGIETVKAEQIKIYPNPFNSSFTINTGSQPVDAAGIYDVMGTCIKTITLQHKTGNITVDMNSAPLGIYIYKIWLANGEAISGRIVKQ